MITKELTCIECPMGCHIEVDLEYDNKVVAVRGNSCPRGKAYAETEVVCPMRVVTSSVRATDGTMVCVKTAAPVRNVRRDATYKRRVVRSPRAGRRHNSKGYSRRRRSCRDGKFRLIEI